MRKSEKSHTGQTREWRSTRRTRSHSWGHRRHSLATSGNPTWLFVGRLLWARSLSQFLARRRGGALRCCQERLELIKKWGPKADPWSNNAFLSPLPPFFRDRSLTV